MTERTQPVVEFGFDAFHTHLDSFRDKNSGRSATADSLAATATKPLWQQGLEQATISLVRLGTDAVYLSTYAQARVMKSEAGLTPCLF